MRKRYLTKVWLGRGRWWYIRTRRFYKRRYRRHVGITSYEITKGPE